MARRKILSIVEGRGEVFALPILLTKLLKIRQRFDLDIAEPKDAHGRSNLIKPDGLEKFLEYVRQDKNCAGSLVLLDADKDCPVDLTITLANRTRALKLPVPVVIVCAKCEYEVWFLASLETIAGNASTGLPAGLKFSGDIEEKRGVKEWLTKQMRQGRAYKETEDQAAMTELIDFELARKNSRSFHRLDHALDQLLTAIDSQQAIVTPL